MKKSFVKNEVPQPNGRGIFSQASSGAKSLAPPAKPLATHGQSENTSLTHGLTPGMFAKGDKCQLEINRWRVQAFVPAPKTLIVCSGGFIEFTLSKKCASIWEYR